MVNVYRNALEKIFEKDDHSRRDEITKTTSEIERISFRLVVLQNQFLDGHITPQDYNKMKDRVEKDLTGLEPKLKAIKMDKSPYKTYVNQTLPML